MINPHLLEILCCPEVNHNNTACHGQLKKEPPIGLRCCLCGVVYPIKNGIPIIMRSQDQQEDWQ